MSSFIVDAIHFLTVERCHCTSFVVRCECLSLERFTMSSKVLTVFTVEDLIVTNTLIQYASMTAQKLPRSPYGNNTSSRIFGNVVISGPLIALENEDSAALLRLHTTRPYPLPGEKKYKRAGTSKYNTMLFSRSGLLDYGKHSVALRRGHKRVFKFMFLDGRVRDPRRIPSSNPERSAASTAVSLP